jgi:Transposase DDE domain group 1
LAGYEDINDAERLSQDPTFRLMTRLSCHRFRSNQVRLALSLSAYNLGNLWRRLALPKRIENWSLASLQQRLVKTGGRLVKHARYYWLLLAEGHLNRQRFRAMLGRIALLPVPTG